MLDLYPDGSRHLKYVATFGQKFPIILKKETDQPHLIWRRLFYIGNCDNAALADELWVTCLETCTLKTSHSHDLWKCGEQGEGGGKEEEQVNSREQILLSSQPGEALKQFDIYVHFTHTVLQFLLHITQDNTEVYNTNISVFFFFFSLISSLFSA